MSFHEWMTVTTIAGLAIISPGPGFAVVVKNSLAHGREAGIATAFGNALGDMAHVALNLLGIGLLVANSPGALGTIRLAGALYLFWLGIKGILSKARIKSTSEVLATAENRLHGFYDGFLATLLNPKAFIFVFALFSVVISPETSIYCKMIYGLWVGVLSLCWFMIVATFFTEPKFVNTFHLYRHWLERATGLILIIFSIGLLLS